MGTAQESTGALRWRYAPLSSSRLRLQKTCWWHNCRQNGACRRRNWPRSTRRCSRPSMDMRIAHGHENSVFKRLSVPAPRASAGLGIPGLVLESPEDLENTLTESKTKSFVKMCDDCNVNSDQKVLLVVSKKTLPLKLATQNLKNVELILASNLNTLSLLKAKQIILSSLSINDIKETYCD